MDLPFTDTFFYTSLIVIGTPLLYFLTKSGFSYQEEKKRVLISIFLAPVLILLLMSALFGIEKTTERIGDLFEDFLQFVIYSVLGVVFLAVCWTIFMFLVSDNKKEMLGDVAKIISKIGSKNK